MQLQENIRFVNPNQMHVHFRRQSLQQFFFNAAIFSEDSKQMSCFVLIKTTQKTYKTYTMAKLQQNTLNNM